MIHTLEGTGKIRRVDSRIFTLTYHADCMGCTDCADGCCSYGADCGSAEKERILQRREEIAPFVPFPPEEWFRPESEIEEDEAMPGGFITGTNAVDGRCVFLNREARGCLLHVWGLRRGVDYHDIKPMVCSLFPVTFDGDLLTHSDEALDGDLACAGRENSLYQGARRELLHYFGPALVEQLDNLSERYSPLRV